MQCGIITKDQDVHRKFHAPIYNFVDVCHYLRGQVEQRRNRLKCGSHYNVLLCIVYLHDNGMAKFEWVVVCWKMQCTTHLRLVLKMLVRNVGFKNVKPSVCTVRELLQPLQSIVDVQACSDIVVVTTIKLPCS